MSVPQDIALEVPSTEQARCLRGTPSAPSARAERGLEYTFSRGYAENPKEGPGRASRRWPRPPRLPAEMKRRDPNGVRIVARHGLADVVALRLQAFVDELRVKMEAGAKDAA